MAPSTHLSLLRALHGALPHADVWRGFLDRYRNTILLWVRSHGLDEHDAEDVAQTVLAQLSRRLPEFEFDPSQGKFRSWLAKVVHHAVINFWRKEGQRIDKASGGTTAMHVLQSAPAAAEIAERLEAQLCSDLELTVEAVRHRVSETRWKAFWLLTIEGLSGHEVAERLGIKRAAAYQASYAVARLLREHYAPSHAERPA